MPYPRENLNPHEEVVLDLHPHWWYFAKSVAALVLAVAVGSWLGLKFEGFLQQIGGVLVLVCVAWVIARWIKWVSTNFVLTTDRVIWREGVLAKKGVEIPLDKVVTVHFSQRIFERMFGLGDLRIDSASESGVQTFSDIKRPNQVQNEIYIQMEANENRKFDRVTMNNAAPAPSAADELHKLADLLERGAITEAEYEAKKADLLGRM